MVAAGPLVIMTMRSARRSASSTSWVTMSTVSLLGLPQRHQLVLQLHARQRVEQRERLVQQQEARLEGERPRDADPLLHARRQLARIALALPSSPTAVR